MANGDTTTVTPPLVKVRGPDGKVYGFPQGTTKDSAVAYFKKKSIGVSAPAHAPATQPQTPPPTVDERVAQWAEQNYGEKATKQAPSWYGATAKYLAGEGLGAGLAVEGAAKGTAKLGYDLVSSLAADISPFVSYDQKKQISSKANEDAFGAVKGIKSLATDLLKPETYTDPIKFGGEVANVAMTVDGAKEMAKSFAKKSALSPVEEAKAVDIAGDHGMKEAVLKPRVHAVAWAQLKGAELGKKFAAARKQVSAETGAQFDNISKQIDTTLPKGSIAVGDLVKTIKDNYADTVKTPEKMNSALSQLVDYSSKIQPGLSPFEVVKQFRTKVFKAMKEGDPQGSVL